MAAPKGNRNAAKENRIFGDELRKAIAQDKRKRIRSGIEKLLDKVALGDLDAIHAVADRTDGRPTQTVAGTLEAQHNFLFAVGTGKDKPGKAAK